MRNFEHGGNLYAAMREQSGQMTDFLDFSANINPLGIPDSVKEALAGALPYIIHYPDTEATELKMAISRQYGVAVDHITVGNGAVEPIYLLCHMLKPKQVLVAAPAFGEYERAARAGGAQVRYAYLHPEEGFGIQPEKILQQADSADIIFLGNPNNPTGTLLTNSQIRVILDRVKQQNTLVVVDESFLDFLPDDSSYTCRSLLPLYPRLVIIHSLTKFYAIPGLRLGFALAGPDITALLHTAKDPWNVNSLAQSAGVAALGDAAYRLYSREFVQRVKQELYEKLTAFPEVSAFAPAVNFILLDIKRTGFTAGQLRERLRTECVLIRDCSNYPGLSDTYVRVAVKRPEQNERLLAVLRKVIDER